MTADPWTPECHAFSGGGDHDYAYICTRDESHGGWHEAENLAGEIIHRWKDNT